MSYGRPPNVESFSGKPPALGSFPLDHDGELSDRLRAAGKSPAVAEFSVTHVMLIVNLGECKELMKEYIKCVRANKNNNGACRDLSRAYLQCRMER